MIALIENRRTFATFNTFEEAKARVEAMGVVFMEDDADHPNCADAFMTDGRVIAIQPVDFKL